MFPVSRFWFLVSSGFPLYFFLLPGDWLTKRVPGGTLK
jgi:hypothetical protein